jgi:deoxyribonuclease IV
MSKTPADQLLIGAHTSAAGGAHKALLHGAEIGATTIQLFTANQKQWVGKPISGEEVARWKEIQYQTGIQRVMSHAGYLINLGSPKEEGLIKSRQAFREELLRCHQLNLSFLNFHPGAALDSSREECLDTIVASLIELEDLADKGKTELLLEMTAGQGSSIGHTMEEIGYLISKLHQKIQIGVCIDTCHIFAAGYDIRTEHAWNQTLEAFDQHIGLKYLKAFHINDSIHTLGSHKDRHAHLGEGEIGLTCFKFMMQDSRLRDLPKYLETRDPSRWPEEIQLLRKFAT